MTEQNPTTPKSYGIEFWNTTASLLNDPKQITNNKRKVDFTFIDCEFTNCRFEDCEVYATIETFERMSKDLDTDRKYLGSIPKGKIYKN